MGANNSTHKIAYLDQTTPLLSIKNTYIKDPTNPIMLENFDNKKINIIFVIFILIFMCFIIINKKNDI